MLSGKVYVVYPPVKTRIFGRILGFCLVSLSVAVLALNFWPAAKLEAVYRIKNLRKVTAVVDAGDLARTPSKFRLLLAQSDIEIVKPVNRDFGLVIPAIGVNTSVQANIDLANEDNFQPILTNGVAHGLGTSFPGQGGTIYIFGHSSDFGLDPTRQATFYLLDKLQEGEEISIFYKNWRYIYRVSQKTIVKGDDMSFLQNNGEEKLVLQTCWPPNTRWYRLMIIAKPILT